MVIVDRKRRIIFHPDKKMVGSVVNADFLVRMDQEEGSFVDFVNEKKMLVVYSKSDKTGWTLLRLIPMQTLADKTQAIRMTILWVTGLCLVLVWFLTMMVSRQVVRPITQVTDLFKALQAGNSDKAQRLPEPDSKDEIHDLIRWFNTFLDSQSAKNRVEEALTESREQYRSVVNNLTEVIFQTDAEGNWTFLNPAWTEITGFDVESSLGRNFLEYIHPDDLQQNKVAFEQVTGKKIEFHRHMARYLTTGGGFRHLEVFFRSTQDRQGNVFGIAGTLNDMTERVIAEQDLQRAKEAAEGSQPCQERISC